MLSSEPAALMFLDLDGFKRINDTLGHDSGDELLKKVSQWLAGCVREEDSVARLGGDEFVVVELIRDDLSARLENQVSRIRELVDQPIALDGRTERITASVGVAVARHLVDDPAPVDMLRDAEIALHA